MTAKSRSLPFRLPRWDQEIERASDGLLSIQMVVQVDNDRPCDTKEMKWLERYSSRCQSLDLSVKYGYGVLFWFCPDINFSSSTFLRLSLNGVKWSRYSDQPTQHIDMSSALALDCLIMEFSEHDRYPEFFSNAIITLPSMSSITHLHVQAVLDHAVVNLLEMVKGSLEELVWVTGYDGFDLDSLEGAIKLPKLRKLQLRGLGATYCIGSLHAPLLNELVMINPDGDERACDWRKDEGKFYIYTKLHTFYYEGLDDHREILSVLSMCPNITSLCVRSMVLLPSFEPRWSNGPRRSAEEYNSDPLCPAELEFFNTLCGSSSATHPLSSLRRFYISPAGPNKAAKVRRMMKEIYGNPTLEVYIVSGPISEDMKERLISFHSEFPSQHLYHIAEKELRQTFGLDGAGSWYPGFNQRKLTY